MMWQAIENRALQYVVMIGGTYVLTASFAIFIFASRLFTNRTVMAGIGKAYIPVEAGEVGKTVRKMITSQFERSATIAWESRPRDLVGEVLQAEQQGILPAETASVGRNDYTVGREIPIDPSYPPWGEVRHPGWSSPAPADDSDVPNLEFNPVIEELPNLIEARAVSLAPSDETGIPSNGAYPADPVVFDVLRRPETMGMRDYLTQLSYLGLVNPMEVGQSFLHQYERARFNGLPISTTDFKKLMSSFADLLSGMTELDPDIIGQIRVQAGNKSSVTGTDELYPNERYAKQGQTFQSHSWSEASIVISPTTARTAPSRNVTPYLQQQIASEESIGSVLYQSQSEDILPSTDAQRRRSGESTSLESTQDDTGSVIRHTSDPED